MAQPFAQLIALLTPKRRWAQFSLGTMFVVVTVLCVWLAVQVNRAHRQRDAVAALRKLGAAVFYVDPADSRRVNDRFPVLRRCLGAAYVEPVEYVSLRHATRLYTNPETIEAALILVKELPGLLRLNLEGLPLTERDIDHVVALSEIRHLDVGYTGISDAAVARIEQALPKCRVIP
jgi:hypothetical protein